ncbi:helix-turn-helix domain-containing protein [Mycolicibacterium sp. XJ1904]
MTFSKLTWLRSLDGTDLTDGEYRVLVAIFNHTDERGRKCYAKQTSLAAETGKSDRQVRRIIPELVRKGWLTEVRKGSGRSGLASEFNLSTPEIPDTDDRYSGGITDISGTNTGHLEQEYRTFGAQIPDTHVLPSDPDIRSGSGPVVPVGDLSGPGGEASVRDDRQRRDLVETEGRSLRSEGGIETGELDSSPVGREPGEAPSLPDRADASAGDKGITPPGLGPEAPVVSFCRLPAEDQTVRVQDSGDPSDPFSSAFVPGGQATA